jgi:cation diffusion facilitator family transporter
MQTSDDWTLSLTSGLSAAGLRHSPISRGPVANVSVRHKIPASIYRDLSEICAMTDARLKRSLRVTLMGLVVNALLTSAKFTAGILGHSHALIADAVESLSDIFSSIIVWRGVVVAAAPADEDHPYGHGKAEPIAAAIVSTMLLVAAGWIAVQAFREIGHPHPAPAPYTLLVLLLVICIKEGLFRFVLREAISVESSAIQTDAWHHRSDAITSLAAAIGISVALLGGKGYESADEVAAIVAAGIIVWNAWRLLRPAVNELMDRSPSREFSERIRHIAESVQGVDRVEKCLVRKMGYYFYADMHVEVHPQMTVQQSHNIAHEVKDNIRTQIPQVRDVLVHIEPSRQGKL